MKRIIFDIDYTLLVPNYDKEYYFFKKYIKDNDLFLYHMSSLLKEYEKTHKKYEKSELLKYLNNYTSEYLDDEFLKEWFNYNTCLKQQDVYEVKKILTYLKSKYELVVLSNWFKEPQIGKLKKLDLFKYFDYIYAGDDFLKPYPESYKLACGINKPSECIMIGDNLECDVIGPISNGLNAIHFTNGKEVNHEYQKVKKLNELKKIL